jgi:hypothetical protein
VQKKFPTISWHPVFFTPITVQFKSKPHLLTYYYVKLRSNTIQKKTDGSTLFRELVVCAQTPVQNVSINYKHQKSDEQVSRQWISKRTMARIVWQKTATNNWSGVVENSMAVLKKKAERIKLKAVWNSGHFRGIERQISLLSVLDADLASGHAIFESAGLERLWHGLAELIVLKVWC